MRRLGAASPAVLALLAVLCLAGVALLLVLGPRDADVPALEPPPPPTTTGQPTGRPGYTLAHEPVDAATETRERGALQEQLAPATFDGTGTIAGRVHLAAGVPVPATWRLVVEPSRVLAGRERAESRVLELAGDELDFEVRDLPQAGYTVRAESDGLNSTEVEVLLARGLERQYVMLRLEATGFLDGGVTNARGEPLEGVPVTLEVRATKLRRETVSDAAGNYVFRDVLDGAYTLTFGAPEAPLLPPRELLFSAPSLRVPTLEIPHDGELRVTVRDATQVALPDVHVRGWGSAGGVVDGRTDSAGTVAFRFLPPGEYKLVVGVDGLDARSERSARGRVEVRSGEVAELVLSLED